MIERTKSVNPQEMTDVKYGMMSNLVDIANNYFTLEELCASETADKLGILNEPTPEQRKNLQETINTLNGLRESWGSPITVTSGYRCPALNSAVGGAKDSAHLYGYAADLVPSNGKMSQFKAFCTKYFQNVPIDQVLLETNKTREWVHVGLYSGTTEKKQRNQIKILNA